MEELLELKHVRDKERSILIESTDAGYEIVIAGRSNYSTD